jgi:hypothetical protein
MEFLAPILGFLSPFAKLFFEYKNKKLDNQHELKMLELMNQRDQAEYEYRMEEMDMQADIAESQALVKIETNPVGETFIDKLRASVRPVTTYYYLLFYTVVKAATFYIMIANPGGLPWHDFTVGQAIAELWTKEEMVFFATILSFWFGNRAMEKSRNYVINTMGK